jgi:two-component system, NtrC family, response regulator AtoC
MSLENLQNKLPIVLVVDDDRYFLGPLKRALRSTFNICSFTNPLIALSEHIQPNIILLDVNLDPEDDSNRDGLKQIRPFLEQFPGVPIVMISGSSDLETAVEAMKEGAIDFIVKRGDYHEIRARLERVIDTHSYQKLPRQFTVSNYNITDEIIGISKVISNIKNITRALAEDGNATVLIRGESGTGKEVIACALHKSGARRHKPYSVLVIPAIPLDLLESELFGNEKGAFTTAEERRIGQIEQADGGVLALDEIGEASLGAQIKLLRFLEERSFTRLGGHTLIRVNVQVVAMTNANLESKMESGEFRDDLYYRLKVHEIWIPPLRDRREDIVPLTEHFLKYGQKEYGRISTISLEAQNMLVRFNWPGNVRQLRNTLESATFWAALRKHSQIEIDDLPADILGFTNK